MSVTVSVLCLLLTTVRVGDGVSFHVSVGVVSVSVRNPRRKRSNSSKIDRCNHSSLLSEFVVAIGYCRERLSLL